MSARISGEVSLEDLAKSCQLSASHFSRAFKNTVGATPHSWLTAQRMEKAKALLGRTGLTLDSVAIECGFAHRVSFSRTFQRVVGASPARWRRLHRASRLEE
jgi:transcriptional regulator GlxA family with amidase domain